MMNETARNTRTVRLLSAQLEALAIASERAPRRRHDLKPYVERAVTATRNAIELHLLSPEEAGAIWADVAGRHPGAHWDELQTARALWCRVWGIG